MEKKQKDRDILNKNYNEIESEIQSEFYSNNKQKVNKLDKQLVDLKQKVIYYNNIVEKTTIS